VWAWRDDQRRVRVTGAAADMLRALDAVAPAGDALPLPLAYAQYSLMPGALGRLAALWAARAAAAHDE
jgi:hypothetical protein